MPDQPVHHHHIQIAARLKRAHGHLRTVIEMIDGGKACVDIAQQLQAVEKAISQAKKTLIQDHVDHCLGAVVSQVTEKQQAALDEFKVITKYL